MAKKKLQQWSIEILCKIEAARFLGIIIILEKNLGSKYSFFFTRDDRAEIPEISINR